MCTTQLISSSKINVNKLSDQAGNINTCLCPVAHVSFGIVSALEVFLLVIIAIVDKQFVIYVLCDDHVCYVKIIYILHANTYGKRILISLGWVAMES